MESSYTQQMRQHDHHHEPSDAASPMPRCSDNGQHGMNMYFHFSELATILFSFWKTDSALSILAACVVVFIVAVLYELLKFYREWLRRNENKRRLEGGAHRRRRRHSRRSRRRHRSSSMTVDSDSVGEVSLPMSTASGVVPNDGRNKVRLPWLAPMHMYQTLLHMVQVTISFMLMLVFMTFNVWLCMAVVLGAGLGYFLFFVREESITEHCN
ncbi:protein SLC31A2 [Drosophila sulfurigaster albostrigata]|uniref:protein SLC31A2 n=1 Tax=Drosophila sulfurigaster albostrigata TaxID=89887 RepID=UPI002D21C329|nr:protein SLC31A2 [Drosophila sulfurigaster albostrigata]